MGLSNLFDLGPNHPIRAAFYRHGVHCATHQIRVIIISCALMCVLLYPALATHYSSQPLTHFSTKMLDSFLPPNTPATAFRTDVRHVWEGHDIYQVREDAAALAKCGTERTIRIERVIVPSTAPDARGALNKHTLLSTLDLQHKISAVLAENDFTDAASCIRDSKGKCLFLSPLEFWQNDENIVNADTKLAKTVNFGPNTTLSGIPLHATTTLAGRASDPHSGKTTYAADFLALTYFFPEVMCHDNFGHSLWRRGLEHATAGFASISHTAYRPQLLALEHSTPSSNMASSSLAIYVAYFIATVYLAAPLWRMRSVHSRIGLAFTAFVELLASTVMSISVCVMWGWRVSMVPWTVLPAVIVIVGTENMWHLLSALNSTPLTLPVKERVGIAMSQAGTTNTMELIAYNSLLGTIACFTVGAVRQFCVFGMVVLIVHWFMIHTFWITVLSIDAQRLELVELLRQGPERLYGASNMGNGNHIGNNTKTDQQSNLYKLCSPLLRFMRRHYAINSTLLMFVCVMVGLYFKYPFASKQSQVRSAITHGIISSAPPEPSLPVLREGIFMEAPSIDPAEHFWDLINPTKQALVHLRIETPTIVQLRPVSPDSDLYPDPGPLSRFFYNVFRPGLWMIKIMVLPIGATMGLLWGFLAYLLKDADVLEAQRNRTPVGPRQASRIGKESIGDHVVLSVLPRNLGSDVDLVASDLEGKVLLSLSIDNELVCWFLDDDRKCRVSYDLLDYLPNQIRSIPTVISIAVGSGGEVCAAGTDTGLILVWNLVSLKPEPMPILSSSSAVSSLAFIGSFWANTTAGRGSMSSLDMGAERRILVAGCEDGSSTRWDVGDGSQLGVIVRASDGHGHTRIVAEDHGSYVLHAVVFRLDGSLQLNRCNPLSSDWQESCVIVPPTSEATLHVALHTLRLGDNYRTVAATCSAVGDISVWDADDGSLLHSSPSTGTVHKLTISSLSQRRCQQCGETPMPGFVVCAGVEDTVRILRGTLPAGGRRCSCLHDYSITVPSLTGSGGGSNDSQKESLDGSLPPPSPPKRQLSHMSLPPPQERPKKAANGSSRVVVEERGSFDSVPPSPMRLSTEAPPSRASLDQPRGWWHGLRVQPLPDIDCERGTWDVIGHVLIGIRRYNHYSAESPVEPGQKPESKVSEKKTSDEDGLKAQDLQRWEAWTLDISEAVPVIHASALDDLKLVTTPVPTGAKARSRIYPRLPFTRVMSAAVTGPGSFAAGFGNIIGIVDFTQSTTTAVPTTGDEAFSFPLPSRQH
ncbi:hypothetical protein DACRYDRAFT_113587 [Dacryopinax primogenitus]|uniref:Sterol regulatory element-binding protein cleavage-activating protein n=1 Tax=Dacryopinax primogenitus (strain DJM 731) TaxID=1858805 RepID=M5GAU0_DACPD|nr:uncharacterized protein DACRYDRAFT_113587 [Dacryopinax primogenitus]EJU05495.1 hypothetical protein DACRYDRAFT_113587 [Dacryopinax primogenitus]